MSRLLEMPGQVICYGIRRRLAHVLTAYAKVDVTQTLVDNMTEELAIHIVETSPALDTEEDTLP